MELIADILLVAGALGAGLYCFVLSRRLSRFNDLENGVGGAVAVLSAQVDDLTRALSKAQGGAHASEDRLKELTERAENAARELELMMASMHDLPRDETPKPAFQEPGSSPRSRLHMRASEADTTADPDVETAREPGSADAGPVFSRSARGGE